LRKRAIVISSVAVGLATTFVFAGDVMAESGKKGLVVAQAPASAPASPRTLVTGKVVSTMSSGGYTYVEIESADKKRTWVAVPTANVNVGDNVEVKGGMVMDGFTSKSLNRTFDSIIFADAISTPGKGGAAASAPSTPMNAPHPGQDTKPKQEIKPGSIAKAKGGYTVAEIFAKKTALKDKKVSVKGKVTKTSSGIMGKNWLHIQDGSGKDGTNDLTVTTAETAAVGDVVTVTGTLAVDKDFGMGYFYNAILENATVKK